MEDIITCCVCNEPIRSDAPAGTSRGKYYCGVHIHKMVDPHEAEVRRIAEVLILILYPISIVDSYGLPYSEEKLQKQSARKMQICLPAARAMVAEMAAQYEAGYEQAAKDYGYAIAHSDPDIKAYQIERGLIPTPTKTGE